MKIGLFFGSFNPMHIGHKVIASYILEFSDLQQVWFIVSPQNPLKKKTKLIGSASPLDDNKKGSGGQSQIICL